MLYLIQNDPDVPPGSLSALLTVPHRTVHPYRGEQLPDISDISALIVLGGAMGACDDHRFPFLIELRNLIRSLAATDIPYLGICLGGQLLAAALGAAVVSRRWQERGTMQVALTADGLNDPLFAGIATPFTTFQWHNDSFDLPDGALLLAGSPACPHQAFRVGTCTWGVQFHPEVTEQIIRNWCGWDARTQERAEMLVEEFSAGTSMFDAASARLIHNFCAYCTGSEAYA